MGKRIHPSCHTVDTRRARFNGKGGVTRVALVTVHSGAKRPCPIRLIRLSSSWRAAVFRRGQINKRIEQQPFHQKKTHKTNQKKEKLRFRSALMASASKRNVRSIDERFTRLCGLRTHLYPRLFSSRRTSSKRAGRGQHSIRPPPSACLEMDGVTRPFISVHPFRPPALFTQRGRQTESVRGVKCTRDCLCCRSGNCIA